MWFRLPLTGLINHEPNTPFKYIITTYKTAYNIKKIRVWDSSSDTLSSNYNQNIENYISITRILVIMKLILIWQHEQISPNKIIIQKYCIFTRLNKGIKLIYFIKKQIDNTHVLNMIIIKNMIWIQYKSAARALHRFLY